jgi:hypothetical protein
VSGYWGFLKPFLEMHPPVRMQDRASFAVWIGGSLAHCTCKKGTHLSKDYG